MIKLLSALLSASVLFIIPYFLAPETGPRVTVEVPQLIRPGETAEVKLTVEKGSLEDFARLQIFLPEGLTADGGNLQQAQLLHEDNFVKFIWIKLPPEPVFTVSLLLHIDGSASGTKYLKGFFYFLNDNASTTVTLEETAIEISPDAEASELQEPEVTRRIIAGAPGSGIYQVELDIHPHAAQLSAHFIDELPAGFTAEALETRGAVFRQEANQVLFRWSALPADTAFTIRYEVKGPAKSGAPEINGMLVFGGEESEPDQSTADSSEAAADRIVKELLGTEQKRRTGSAAAGNTPALSLPAPTGALFYSVQIAATNRSPKRDNAWFSSRYHFNQTVSRTEHEGWNKYLIGQFGSYHEARALRNNTRGEVSDAFIVAYDESGNRIPVGKARGRKPLNQ